MEDKIIVLGLIYFVNTSVGTGVEGIPLILMGENPCAGFKAEGAAPPLRV